MLFFRVRTSSRGLLMPDTRPQQSIPQLRRKAGGALRRRAARLRPAPAVRVALVPARLSAAHEPPDPLDAMTRAAQPPPAGQGSGAAAGQPDAAAASTYDVPPFDVGAQTLTRRAEQQRGTVGKFKV